MDTHAAAAARRCAADTVGDPNVVRERLGEAVRDIVFDRATILVPALSVAHHRDVTERTAGPALKLVESLRAADGRIFDHSSGEGLIPDVLQRGCRACCRQIISAPAMTSHA